MKGFTLLEIMVVVVIIAILASIAYPSYINYKIRVNRAEVKAEMLRIASILQQYKIVKYSYADADLEKLNISQVFPNSNEGLYSLNLNVSSDQMSYELVAKPLPNTIQKNNGVVCLNDEGHKYWSFAAVECALSASSNWDGR